MPIRDISDLVIRARKGVNGYLDKALETGAIDKQSYGEAKRHVVPTLKQWLGDADIRRVSPRLQEGLVQAIDNEQWRALVDAFRQPLRFGTGGIRGMMAFRRPAVVRLKREGVGAPILKGPNMINDVVLLATSAGVARFGRAQRPRFRKIVVGYDSRIRGDEFAGLVAQLFLAYDYTVYLFDAPCPYPEVTFAIPDDTVKADVGVFISASHNDYRYNGYKLSCGNGSQFDPTERDVMYTKYIAGIGFDKIRLRRFDQVPDRRLWFLGGEKPVPGFNYAGRESQLINMHKRHLDHVKKFLLTKDLREQQRRSRDPLRIAYCAFHGAGREAVPRLLRDVGFPKSQIQIITAHHLNRLDGLFPCFCSEEGREQQPDPGDPRAAKLAVDAFKQQYPGQFGKVDILIGTDPDADRCGIVVKVPKGQRDLYDRRDYTLLSADDAWALLLWYRLEQQKRANRGHVQKARRKFIVLSHTTSDSIARLARRYGLGVVKTWVGFASLAAATREVWQGRVGELLDLEEGRGSGTPPLLCHPFVYECDGMDRRRSINVGAMEQSNGFSILGGPPPDARSLGRDGHVRDKDGTLAALLMAEVAAWAKQEGTTLLELLDSHIYLDPAVGLFVNLYEPDPMDGEYPGIEGDRLKKAILRRALGYFQLALTGDLQIGGLSVKSACLYRTGKYDAIYPPTHNFVFPDEGIRFYFDEERLDHVTVRPSGTGNSLRFHVQFHASPPKSQLVAAKRSLAARGKAVMDGIREILKAPRSGT